MNSYKPSTILEDTPKLSVAMATYNGERFLREQLQSLVDQKTRPTELIVSDDASTDRTTQIVADFAKSAPFEVRLIQDGARRGYAGNFNRAMQHSTGDLIFLCDQDDVWFSSKISTIVGYSRDNEDAVVLMNDVSIVDSHLVPTGLTKLEQFERAGYSTSNYVMGAATAVRRDFLQLMLPIPHDYPSHDDWIVRPATLMGRLMLLDIPLQYYRLHGNNTSDNFANSLRPVRRYDIWRRRLNGLIDDRLLEVGPNQIQMLESEVMGLLRALSRAEPPLTFDLERALRKLVTKLEVGRTRASINRTVRLQRLSSIVSLYRAGGYRHYKGAFSAVYDFLARRETDGRSKGED